MLTSRARARQERHERRRARLSITWAVVLAGVLSTTAVSAHPGPAPSLWELTRDAELIVLARVESTVRKPTSPVACNHEIFREPAIATLIVEQTWKGPPSDRVEVLYNASSARCPAPPRFEPGLELVAFLSRDERGAWSTAASSYGTLYPELSEVGLFRELILRAVSLQTMKDRDDRERGLVQLWVDAATEPATRWHGLHGLVPPRDRRQADGTRGASGPKSVALRADQRVQLARAFVEKPRFDFTLPMLLGLLTGFADAAVDEMAVAVVDALLEEAVPPRWTADLAELTAARVQRSLPPAPPAAPPASSLKSDGEKTFERSGPPRDPRARSADVAELQLRQRWQLVRKSLPFAPRKLDLPLSPRAVWRPGKTPPP